MAVMDTASVEVPTLVVVVAMILMTTMTTKTKV